jgi:hypothetical protein
LLRSVGILLIMVAFNWWLIIYGRANDLRGVAECMVDMAERCVSAWPPFLMWAGIAVLGVGLILQLRSWRAQAGYPIKSGVPAE